jgi:tetraprenyl-beta-curcumene synthase
VFGHAGARVILAGTFAAAGTRYWSEVFPRVTREVHHWRQRATEIPDPTLRRLALRTQRHDRGNLDGAAAFAVLAPRAHTARLVRAVVAFQAAYDFVDTLAEQPSADPLANGRQLHLALLAALDPGTGHADYYAHNATRGDDGYMCSLVDACRAACAELPSYSCVAEPVLGAARRMLAFQVYNHAPRERPFARWATRLTPPGSGLRWWETAAGAASSLGVFALIAAAGQPQLPAPEAAALHDAYFPWIGALHVLLDSLVDQADDLANGRHSLVAHYATPEEAALRLRAIATRAMQATQPLSSGTTHALLLAAMIGFYLSAPAASSPAARLAAAHVTDTMGALATPTLLVHRARRAAARVITSAGRLPAAPGCSRKSSS